MKRGAVTKRSAGRLPRLLTLVPYLLARPGASVGEVAAAFGVSEKELIDDLQLIWMCGLPGHTPADLIDVSWDGDEIIVSNADAIARPLRLATDEASALLVALRMLAELPDLSTRDALSRVIAKLESAAEDAVAVSSHVAVEVETSPRTLPAVKEAIDRGRRIWLRYYVPSRDETTEREADPMRLLVADGRSYLEAWCRRAEDVRLFRLDRIRDMRVLEAAADPPVEAEPRDVGEGLFRPSAGDALVELELSPAGRWVVEYYPCESVTELGDGRVRAALRTPELGWVRRLALRLGESGRILAPADLAEDVRRSARQALAAYEETP